MDTLFLVCAVSGGVVLILQFLAGTLGMLGDHDHDTDHDHGYDTHSDHGHHAEHHGGASWFAGLLTFRTITSGLTFFGLCGLTALWANADPVIALTVAGLGGIFALFAVQQMMKGLKRLKSDGSARIERTVGAEAVVYLQIPANNTGPGKVTVVVQKRTMEYTAYTLGNTGLPTGSKVRITAVRNPTTVEVEAV